MLRIIEAEHMCGFAYVVAVHQQVMESLEDAPWFVKDYHAYYKTPRGYHKRSGNSNDGWNVTGCQSFLNQPLLLLPPHVLRTLFHPRIPRPIIPGRKRLHKMMIMDKRMIMARMTQTRKQL